MRTLCALLLLAVCCIAQPCGTPDVPGGAGVVIRSRFLNQAGWDIPGLKGATVEHRFTSVTGQYPVLVNVTVYKPTQTAQVALQGFRLESDGKSLTIVPGYVQLVQELRSFDVAGKVFAYSVSTVSLREAEPTMAATYPPPPPRKAAARRDKGLRGQGVLGGVLGCGFTDLYYFDEDGNGKFTVMQYSGFGGRNIGENHGSPAQHIPEWALRLASTGLVK